MRMLVEGGSMTSKSDLQCEDCSLIVPRADAEAYLNALNVCPGCGGALKPTGDEASTHDEDSDEALC